VSSDTAETMQVPMQQLPTPFLPAFDLAMREFGLGRTQSLRAYYGLLPGLHFGPCAHCGEIGFLQPSGLDGWTCTRCELELDAVLAERVS